jgi:predicted peptidase
MTIKTANGDLGFLQTIPSGTGPFPTMIFLHGIGERGNGTTELNNVARYGPPAVKPAGFVILSPQLGMQYGDWQMWIIDEMLKYAKGLKEVDPARIILTGLSLGGAGVVAYAINHPNIFSCIVPICPACLYNYQGLKTIVYPTWAWVGDKDEIVGATCTTQMNGQIKNYKQTIIAGGDHGSAWFNAYAVNSPLYPWMLQQYKPVENPPTPIPVPVPVPVPPTPTPTPTPTPVPIPVPVPTKPTLVKIPQSICAGCTR